MSTTASPASSKSVPTGSPFSSDLEAADKRLSNDLGRLCLMPVGLPTVRSESPATIHCSTRWRR
eukprot:938159-Prymnesium_polylepis.2